jgi:DNA-binding response OmpR family regulator
MKRLLLVDDDAVVTRTYRDRFSAHGFQVNTAGGGAAALSILRSAKPDLVVLDLMMPEVSGVDVLKYIRSEPGLSKTPVVLLSNTYNNDLGKWAGRIGIDKAFLKAQCSPSVLMAAIDEMLDPGLAAVKPPEPEDEPPMSLATPSADASPTATSDDRTQVGTGEIRTEAGAGLLADAPAICAGLGELFEDLEREARTGSVQQDLLPDLFCKVRYLAEAARRTEFALLAQTTAVFDALLKVLMEKPRQLGPSLLRTVGSLVEVVGLLFERARESQGRAPLSARVLVVDDDPLANELTVAALGQAGASACSTENSVLAWQWLNSEHFDLVLLNIQMPVLDGPQLLERLRRVQGYEKTPVIFVAANDDVDNRATSTLSGADDLIAKNVPLQELAARVVMHLVRIQLQDNRL